MSSYNNVFSKLQQNSSDKFEETTRLLIKVADNILKEPTNLKVRTLQKNNKTVKTKILEVPGGLECLQLMGFVEKDNSYTLPEKTPLSNLQQVKTSIEVFQKHVKRAEVSSENVFTSLKENNEVPEEESVSSDDTDSSSSDEVPDNKQRKFPVVPNDVPKVILPPLTHMFSNPFLNHIEERFHAALAYQDKNLLERARRIIPLAKLEENAQKRLRHLQEQLKKGTINDPEVSLQEMLLLELLNWFKNYFFSWVDCPECNFCGGKTTFLGMSSDPSHLIHTKRVEVYKCGSCHGNTTFPRYNDVNILLITRRGRCGEWANTFTLLCCAMGWDARFVEDQTDHVWTEVYSFAQKRWLHCDSCENTCDTPLMYETGWKKQVSYVIAYSSEEVQDVTWKYTCNHKEVLKRRTKCSESELVDALIRLRERRQADVSKARKDYLTKRLLQELIELMVERKPGDAEKGGRTSGSLQWRLARGETDSTEFVPYTWVIAADECRKGPVTIRYSAALDKYVKEASSSSNKFTLNKWTTGAFEIENVFRKEEKDWKMAYLARKEGTSLARICWKFVIDSEEMVIDSVEVHFQRKTYENGKVNVQICSENICLNFSKDESIFKTDALGGAKTLTIRATLSGGKGDVAWQHSQLFRQEINNQDFPFSVKFTFKPKC